MTKARTLADMISDGVIGTTELADDVITPVKLDETGNYSMAQLGIGTSSPAQELDVNGQVRGVDRYYFKRASDNYSLSALARWDGSTGSPLTGTAGIHTVVGSEEASSSVVFAPSNTERMRITSSGSVGIGASSPATSLHLSSAADPVFRIQRGTGSYSEISSDSNGTLFLRADEGNTTSSSNIRFEVDNTEHMRLDEYGQLILQSNPSTLFLGGTSTGSLVKGTSTGNYLIFGTSGSEAARFVGSNFGIGTTSPSRKLEVVDNGDILQITGTAGNAFARFTDNDASSDFSIGADDNSGAGAGAFMVYDRNNNAYRMIINSSGNVGIGVTNPSNKFQVSDSAGGSIASFTNTTSADLSINLTSGVSLISPSTGILALGTSNTERMRIENNSIRFATDEVTPTASGKDLGSPTYQWRDLWLSGGVYLGGTGSANKLDDYEEGTWTPTFGSNQGGSNSGAVYAVQDGTYVKIGNQVMCNFRILTTSKGTVGGSTARIFGFPFNSSATNITGKVALSNVNVSAVDWRPRGMYGSPLLTLDYKSTASGNYAEAQATALWKDNSECFGYISYFIS